MKYRTTPAYYVLIAVFLPSLTLAHHSFAAVFDPDKPIEVTGTVTNVEWMNPHVWIYVDALNNEGVVEQWAFELGSPNGLIRRGWRHDSLTEGQTVTISGVHARDGSSRGAVRTIVLPSGTSLFGAQDESR